MLECNCPRWALLFTEAPKELPDRNIHLVVIEMATMSVKHILKVLFIVSKAKMVGGGGERILIQDKYQEH